LTPQLPQAKKPPVNGWVFLAAAVLLSLERICYLWIWRAPAAFQAWCRRAAPAWLGEPVDVLRFLFCVFKILQCAVFVGWCYFFGNGLLVPLSGGLGSLAVGAALIVIGQTLNLSVFYRLGKVGVFYGDKFGYEVCWCRKFPFSLLKHPQYVGALLSIWGFFLAMRFPHEDWYILPALETVYYSLGAYFER
jgi:phosphatidyl-N-methylethanolamine N-methyltransferase